MAGAAREPWWPARRAAEGRHPEGWRSAHARRSSVESFRRTLTRSPWSTRPRHLARCCLLTGSLLVASFTHLLLQLLHLLLGQDLHVRTLGFGPLCRPRGGVVVVHLAALRRGLHPDLAAQVNAEVILFLLCASLRGPRILRTGSRTCWPLLASRSSGRSSSSSRPTELLLSLPALVPTRWPAMASGASWKSVRWAPVSRASWTSREARTPGPAWTHGPGSPGSSHGRAHARVPAGWGASGAEPSASCEWWEWT